MADPGIQKEDGGPPAAERRDRTNFGIVTKATLAFVTMVVVGDGASAGPGGPASATAGTPPIGQREQQIASVLGEIDRILPNCPDLALDEAVVNATLERMETNRERLQTSFAPSYQAGVATMDRIFATQDKRIVCAAAGDAFGQYGQVYPGMLAKR